MAAGTRYEPWNTTAEKNGVCRVCDGSCIARPGKMRFTNRGSPATAFIADLIDSSRLPTTSTRGIYATLYNGAAWRRAVLRARGSIAAASMVSRAADPVRRAETPPGTMIGFHVRTIRSRRMRGDSGGPRTSDGWPSWRVEPANRCAPDAGKRDRRDVVASTRLCRNADVVLYSSGWRTHVAGWRSGPDGSWTSREA